MRVLCLLVAAGMAPAAIAPAANAQAPPASASSVVTGTVVDAQTGEALSDAVVRSGGEAVRTGARGEFRIRLEGIIEVRRLGYAPVRLARVAPGDTVRIALAPVVRSLDMVVVTAARREQKLKDAVVSTEVVSRREIEQAGAADVSAAIVGQTGIQLDGGVPSGAGVLLQGLGSQRVLVLLDGQPLVGRVNGNLDLSRVPAGMVERIEIVKGPQSTLYGSEAMGGVVNVITRRPTTSGLDGELVLTGGSHGRRDAALNLLARVNRFDAAVDAGRREIDLIPGRDGESDTFADRWDISPRVSWRMRPRTTLGASALFVDEKQRYRLGQLYQHSDNEQIGARLDLTHRFDARGGRVGATLHHSRFEHLSRRSTTPDPVDGSGETDLQTLLKADVTGSARVAGATLDGGVELRREAIEAMRVQGGRRTLDLVEPFLQATWTHRGVALVPGARVSRSDQWGTAVTPRLALLWRPLAPLAFRGSVSRGFRAPDFKELYLEFVNASAGYAVRGNPSLQPERSTNTSAGVEWTGDVFTARASAYYNRYTDFIESIETETPGEYTYRNLAEGTTAGVDMDASISGRWWRIDAGHAWLRARDADGGPLLGRAEHAARLALSASTGPGPRVTVTTVATGRTPIGRDTAGVVNDWRPGFARVDLRIAQRIMTGFEVILAAENVLDRRMGAEWPGFTGRLLSASLRMSTDRR